MALHVGQAADMRCDSNNPAAAPRCRPKPGLRQSRMSDRMLWLVSLSVGYTLGTAFCMPSARPTPSMVLRERQGVSNTVKGPSTAPLDTSVKANIPASALPPIEAPQPPPPEPPQRQLPSLENGVKIELGKYKADPFVEQTFPPQYIYALQRLQSDTDEAFGAAIISLRSGSKITETRTWKLGRPRATHFLALHRFKLWWMKPLHTDKTSDIPPETQLLLTQLPPDPETGKKLYAVFIPLIDGPAKCSLKGLSDQTLQLTAETGDEKTPVPHNDVAGLLVAVHDDPFKLVEKGFKLANKRIRSQVKGGAFGGLIRDVDRELVKWKRQETIRKGRDLSAPDFVESLGWCTWDSFYTNVDHDKVFKGLDSLRASGINPKWLVLDDGWQSTSNVDAPNGEQWMDHLTSLKANKKFRNTKGGIDLSRTVQKAKQEYGIDYFLVWHAIAGYWAGVDLDSPDLHKYKPERANLKPPPGIVEVDPDMKMFFRVSRFLNKRFGVVPPEHIRDFYDDYHRYLKEQGVDGVKVDAQSVVNFLGRGFGGSVMLSRAFHDALSRSVRKHFSDSAGPYGQGGRIIHCMCHDSHILLQVPGLYGRRPLIRGSDDFYPRDQSSHGPHLYSNAFNSLLIGSCGLQDWDMFQTNIGEASWMHAASRAISGGPVYISDRPGEHNVAILKRMVLDDGTVLRPPSNALPTLDGLFSDAQRDGESLLSVWNTNNVTGHGVVGLFNIYGSAWNQQRRAFGTVPGYKKQTAGASSPADTKRQYVIPGTVKPRDCHSLMTDQEETEHAGRELGPFGSRHRRRKEHDARAEIRTPVGEERFAMYLHTSSKLAVHGADGEEQVRLGTRGYELAAISRVHTLALGGESGRGKGEKERETAGGAVVEWASIGLADMFNAGGAITQESFRRDEASTEAALEVRGSGRFLAFCSVKPTQVTVDGAPVTFQHKVEGVLGSLELQLPSPYIGQHRELVVSWA